MTHSRITVAKDGIQVARTRVEKAYMKMMITVTIYPDGTLERDVPDGRPDLLELEQRLKQPMEMDYVEFPDDR